MYTVLDLFSGIGSFTKELESTGRFKTILACDYDPWARLTYRFNNPGLNKRYVAGDITTLCRYLQQQYRQKDPEQQKDLKYLSDADVACAGIPCQSFSTIGTKKGMTDIGTQTLLVAWKQLIFLLRPKTLLLENVRGFYKKAFVPHILPFLKEHGYTTVDHNFLNCRHYGIPQNRVRLFIVATRLPDLNLTDFMQFTPVVPMPTLNEYLHIEKPLEKTYSITIRTSGYSYRVFQKQNFMLLKVKDSIPPDVVSLNMRDFARLQGFDDLKWIPGTPKTVMHRLIGNTIPRNLTRLIASRLVKRLDAAAAKRRRRRKRLLKQL